jgi:hemolysin activation/secretion protein
MQRPHRPHRLVTALLGLGLGIAHASALAQGGVELQGPVPPKPLPDSPTALPAPPAATPAAAAASGPTVELTGVEFSGNRQLPRETLLERLGPVAGKRFSLAGMNALAQQVVAIYREQGYPFVRAFIPPQQVEGGVLRIQVVEGVLGAAKVAATDPKAAGAQAFLDAGLPSGEIIRDRTLERTMLLLDDQPGFKVQPVMSPGENSGESALTVNLLRRNAYAGEVGIDNAGGEVTGRNRLRGSFSFNSPWRFGDRLSFSAMVTDEQLWLGSAEYEAPIGATGLRAQAGYSRTSYQLGGDFSELGASGTANTASAKLSHPLLRSQRANALLSLSLQHKALQDRFEALALTKDKSSRLAVVAVQFDRKDAFGGGGVTYGQASLTAGHLRLDAASGPLDAATARSAGQFNKLNFDVTRIQKLPGAFSAYGRVSGQWASKNLDASEKYGIGGFLGVRAYPMGEGSGDHAWLSQLELRANVGGASVFAFADAGQAWANADAWDAGASQRRSIAGAGLGLRWFSGGWSLESTLASRVRGGAPTAETAHRNPRFFVSLGYRFDR